MENGNRAKYRVRDTQGDVVGFVFDDHEFSNIEKIKKGINSIENLKLSGDEAIVENQPLKEITYAEYLRMKY